MKHIKLFEDFEEGDKYSLLMQAVQELEDLNFGDQDVVDDAIGDVVDQYKKMKNQFPDEDSWTKMMNLLDLAMQAGDSPSFPTDSETESIEKMQEIITPILEL
jgi:hypothetical protein